MKTLELSYEELLAIRLICNYKWTIADEIYPELDAGDSNEKRREFLVNSLTTLYAKVKE